MKIQPFYDERTATMTYVVFDENTRDAVVIDPVLDYEPVGSRIWTESADVVVDFVKSEDLRVHYILETHAHADHISGAQHLKDQLPNAEIVIGRDITEVQGIFKHVFGLPDTFATDGSQFDRLMAEGEQLEAGPLKVEAIATPGHTPACLTYKIGDAVFTGDALFMPDVGTGRCDFPGGSADDLFESVRDKLYALPPTTRVFVGHDYPKDRDVAWETTIAEQRERNVALPAARDRDDFIAWRNKRDKGLSAPKLLFQSVQVNIDAGKLPNPESNEKRYLKIPLNVFRPAPDPETMSLD
jgi:glyoxylase-like metal-dependent hydrolase (beta-lactamase superfamily II)